MKTTKLNSFNNDSFDTGASFIKRALWYLMNHIFINSALPVFKLKPAILRLFGAKIGKNVCIKPNVNIKFPWKLEIGDNVWLGENVWIDNLDSVYIGNNCCISQGALLLCGNHNYKKTSFDLMTGPIVLEEGVWISAQAVVTQNVRCKSHSILGIGAVANKDLESYTIYGGNPVREIRKREIE